MQLFFPHVSRTWVVDSGMMQTAGCGCSGILVGQLLVLATYFEKSLNISDSGIFLYFCVQGSRRWTVSVFFEDHANVDELNNLILIVASIK